VNDRDIGHPLEPANDNRVEFVTLEAIELNPWSAVDLKLPQDADRSLLEGTALAASECAKAAFAAWRVAEITEPALAPLYRSRNAQAADRGEEARRQLGELPPDRISNVCLFLDPAQVQAKALSKIMLEVTDARPPRAPITAAEIDRNPWSIIRSSLTGVGAEVLECARDCAFGLFREAEQRSAGAYSREEAELWKTYGEAVVTSYLDVDRKLGLLTYAARPLKMVAGDADVRPAPLTQEAIARNPRNAVEHEIPADASRELLSLIAETAADLRETFSRQAQMSLREEEAAEFRDLSGEARRRQQEAEARLDTLDGGPQRAHEQRSVEQPDRPDRLLDSDQAALVDMLGDAASRAVNEPVPRSADAAMLERLSDDLDAALDRLDALSQSSEVPGISPQYIAAQFAKAGARQEEVEARLEEINFEAPEFYRGPIENDRTAGHGPQAGASPAKSDDAFTEEILEALRYVTLCEDAYQRHLESLALPAPRSESERTALETFLKGFEQGFGFRPEIRLEARETLAAAAVATASEESETLVGEHARVPQTTMDSSGAEVNFPSLAEIAARIGEHLARAADRVRERVSGFFGDAPKLRPQQIHDLVQSAGERAAIRDREVGVVADGNEVGHEDRTLLAASGQSERDVYLSTVLGTPATSEANCFGRDEREPEQEPDRGRHL
jgi:hypothetical protein